MDAVGVEGEQDGLADQVGGVDGALEGDRALVGIDVDLERGEVGLADVLGVDDGDDARVVRDRPDLLARGRGLGADNAAALGEVGLDVGRRELPLGKLVGDGVRLADCVANKGALAAVRVCGKNNKYLSIICC